MSSSLAGNICLGCAQWALALTLARVFGISVLLLPGSCSLDACVELEGHRFYSLIVISRLAAACLLAVVIFLLRPQAAEGFHGHHGSSLQCGVQGPEWPIVLPDRVWLLKVLYQVMKAAAAVVVPWLLQLCNTAFS